MNLISKNLKFLSDTVLVSGLKTLVNEERKKTLEVLHYLREIERRRIHLASGYPSLFEFCVKELGYSDGSAHRRLSAMRLIRDLPEAEEKIRSGTLSLSVAAQAKNFFREASKKVDPLTSEQQLAILGQLEGKSTRECERKLVSLLPEAALPRDRTRAVSETHTVIQVTVDAELLEKLERLKGLLAHRCFGGGYADLIRCMADISLNQLDPLRSKPRSPSKVRETSELETPKGAQLENVESTQVHCLSQQHKTIHDQAIQNQTASHISRQKILEKNSEDKTNQRRIPTRFISKTIRREVWERDRGKCTYVDPATGRQCESRYALQFDHRIPFSYGGPTSAQNLQLLCSAHNRFRAEQMGLLKRPSSARSRTTFRPVPASSANTPLFNACMSSGNAHSFPSYTYPSTPMPHPSYR